MKEISDVREINNFVRDAIRNGLDIENTQTVHDFIDKFMAKYETSPETLLFLVQKMNALTLFEQFKKNNHQQIYPTIKLLDPKMILKKYGYSDIFATVARRFEERRQRMQNLPKEARMLTIEQVGELRKAAGARGADAIKDLEEDKRVKKIMRLDSIRKEAAMARLAEKYHNLIGLERFIKVSGLDNNPKIKNVLDTIRGASVQKGFTKQADLYSFLDFKSELESLL